GDHVEADPAAAALGCRKAGTVIWRLSRDRHGAGSIQMVRGLKQGRSSLHLRTAWCGAAPGSHPDRFWRTREKHFQVKRDLSGGIVREAHQRADRDDAAAVCDPSDDYYDDQQYQKRDADEQQQTSN